MYTIILFYKYVDIDNPALVKRWLQEVCSQRMLKGRVWVSVEGINGTLGGTRENIDHYIELMNQHPLFGNIDFKTSSGDEKDFPRLAIKVKKEIVNLGLDVAIISAKNGGVHLSPQEAHALLQNAPDDLVILDGRNDYESRIGAFEGAIKPQIANFRDFPTYIDEHPELFKDKQVLMYCTGGIRCERASAYVKSKNIAKNVFQITGGIHRYVEQFPQGFFKGKNYVFDGRGAMPVTNDILAQCDFCDTSYDVYSNCLNAQCNKQIIACPACKEAYDTTCSSTCRDLLKNGTVPRRPLRYRGMKTCAL